MPLVARRAEAGDAVVGRNIRLHRLSRGMSQTALADGIGITFQQVQKYEKGVNRVGAARLMRIANTLNVPVARLLAGIDGPTPQPPRYCRSASRCGSCRLMTPSRTSG